MSTSNTHHVSSHLPHTTHPTYNQRFNAFVGVASLWVLATALFIAGIATAFNTFRNGTTYIEYTFFDTRSTIGTGYSAYKTTFSCGDLQALIEAGRAFSLATVILSGIIMLLTLGRLVRNDLMLGDARKLFITLMVFCIIFACITWILAFVAYAQSFCDVNLSDSPFNHVGPCGPLFVSGFAIAIIAMALEIHYDGAAENPAPTSHVDAQGTHVAIPTGGHNVQVVHSSQPGAVTHVAA